MDFLTCLWSRQKLFTQSILNYFLFTFIVSIVVNKNNRVQKK